MQIALGSIDALETVGDRPLADAKDRALWFIGIDIAGPSLTGGALLLMNQIAMALFIGLGPLFVLGLLFEQTKALFGCWLYYGIGTMFSLAVLSVMVSIALKTVLAVAAAFWVGSFTGSQEGVSSLALQQGGLGLILTILILSAPPMAAAFFNRVLGNFQAFSAFGGRRSPPEFSGHVYRESDADQPAAGLLMGMRHGYAVPTQAHLDEIKRSPAEHESQASTTMPSLQDIERRIWVELAAQEAETTGMQLAQVRGGPVRAPTPGIPIAENRRWDAALNIAADPLGLLEPYYATKAAMAQAEDAMMKQRVDEFRKGMIDAGVKNVPEGYDRAYFAGGKQGNDYAGTLNKLTTQYLDHVQDKRLREM